MKFSKNILALTVCSVITMPVMAEDINIKMSNGGLKISQGDSSIQFGGRFMLDYDRFDGVHNVANNGNSASDSEIRRGRIYIKSKFDKVWEAKLQININDAKSSANFEDAYLKYSGFSVGSITAGKHKEAFGLEKLTSSKYITTIERSMISDVFSPGRSYGVSLSGKSGAFTYNAGLFEVSQDESDQESYALTGRLTYAPVNEQGNLIHFGLAASMRDYGNQAYQIKKRAEVHTANDKPAVSAITTNTDNVNIVGFEAAGVWGALSLQTEYQQTAVSGSQSSVDADYSGYYVMGSYFLTGESRPYKKGVFGKVTPNSTNGAWELVTRFSNLDVIDNNSGTKTENITLGVNYYANSNVRFMVNYITTEVSGSTVAITDGDAISLRAQYIF
ncbi:MAG: porin [Colwellia sp.]|nr:porin [Colwellia sp.]